MLANDFDAVSEELRKLVLRYVLQGDPMRLLQASLGRGQVASISAGHPNLQKFNLRQVKAIDKQVQINKGVPAPKKKGGRPAAVVVEEDDEEEDIEAEGPFKPTKLNPIYLACHGNTLLLSRSYQPAIGELSGTSEGCELTGRSEQCITCALMNKHRKIQSFA